MITSGTEIIQAFPLHSNTFVGVANGQSGFELIHANEDGTVTLTFNKASVVVPMSKGQDFAINGNCESIDSTMEVILS